MTKADIGESFFVGSGPGFGAFQGANSANFGATGDFDDTISQTLATVAGDLYSISFELAHAPIDTANPPDNANDFSASFGSFTGFAIVNFASPFGYTLKSFTAVASAASTVLAFNGRDTPAFYDLDNVAVVDLGVSPPGVPEPASWALMLAGFLGAGAALRSRRRTAVAATA